jgi:hypothetical protein
MVSSLAGTPGQNQLVVIESLAEINGIGDNVSTSAKLTALSEFALLFDLLSTTTRAALVATTMATITN